MQELQELQLRVVVEERKLRRQVSLIDPDVITAVLLGPLFLYAGYDRPKHSPGSGDFI